MLKIPWTPEGSNFARRFKYTAVPQQFNFIGITFMSLLKASMHFPPKRNGIPSDTQSLGILWGPREKVWESESIAGDTEQHEPIIKPLCLAR